MMEVAQTRKDTRRPVLAFTFRQVRLAEILWSMIRAVLIVGISFIIIYPLLVQISLSVMAAEDLLDLSVHWIPRHFTTVNFEIAYERMNYLQALLTTFLVTAVLSALQVMSCMVVGYGFARFKFRGSKPLFALVVFSLVVPPSTIMVPLFLNFRYFTFWGLLKKPGINLIGSSWPLVLMSLTATAKRNGLFIYIVRQFFRGMSSDLEEAAYVDGAGPLRTFFSIMMPNAKPIIMIIFLFAFVWQWNDLFYSDLFMKGKNLLPLALQTLTDRFAFSWADPSIESVTGELTSHIRLVANAGLLMYIAPLLVLYAALQRYFVESLEKTGIVG